MASEHGLQPSTPRPVITPLAQPMGRLLACLLTSLPSQLPLSACDPLNLTSRALTTNPDLTAQHRTARKPRPVAEPTPPGSARPQEFHTGPLLAGTKGSTGPIFSWGPSGQKVGSPGGKGIDVHVRRRGCHGEIRDSWRSLAGRSGLSKALAVPSPSCAGA